MPGNANLSSNLGFVRWSSNASLDDREAERVLAERVQEEPLTNLASHVQAFWESAKRAKMEVEAQLISILRQIKGEYEPDKLAAIQEIGGSDDFLRLTYHKVRDCESWILDVLNNQGDRTWDIELGGDPEIPPDVEAMIEQAVRQQVLSQIGQQVMMGQMDPQAAQAEIEQQQDAVKDMVKKKAQQVAEERCTNMERLILDQMEAGGWHQAFRACVADLAKFKSCIMKGPIYRREKVLKYRENAETGKWEAVVTDEVIPCFERVSPFDWYPAANSIGVDDGGVIELERLTRKDLQKLIGVPGYKEDAIRAILRGLSMGFRETTVGDAERFQLEKDNSLAGMYDELTDKIDLLNYWDYVPGWMLLEYGLDKADVPDSTMDYQVNVKMVNGQVIKAVINPDPLGKKPYGVTSFVKNHDSQWGECPAELMTDIQGVCNATVRALVNNIAYASGPITETDVTRLEPGESADIWPWKNIQTNNKRMESGPAVRFYQADMQAEKLIAVYEKFKREADDLVIPAYGHGNPDVKGAGNTSSGLAMLMGAASRNIKLAIANVDRDIIIPSVMRLFAHNMRFSADEAVKGDLKVKARGAGTLLVKEQLAVRRNEFRTTLRPADEMIMGTRGMAYVLSENLKALEMDVNQAIPNLKEIEKDLPGAVPPGMGMQPGQQPPGPQNIDEAGQPAQGEATKLFHEGGAH